MHNGIGLHAAEPSTATDTFVQSRGALAFAVMCASPALFCSGDTPMSVQLMTGILIAVAFATGVISKKWEPPKVRLRLLRTPLGTAAFPQLHSASKRLACRASA